MAAVAISRGGPRRALCAIPRRVNPLREERREEARLSPSRRFFTADKIPRRETRATR